MQRWNCFLKNLFDDHFIFSLLSKMTLGFSLVLTFRWQREKNHSAGVRRKSIRLSIMWQIRRSIICLHRFFLKMKNLKLSQLQPWQEWFSPIQQRFSFSFDEETSSSTFRIECSTWEWREIFLFEKEKILLYSSERRTKYLTKFVFKQRTSRIDVWWIRQWK